MGLEQDVRIGQAHIERREYLYWGNELERERWYWKIGVLRWKSLRRDMAQGLSPWRGEIDSSRRLRGAMYLGERMPKKG